MNFMSKTFTAQNISDYTQQVLSNQRQFIGEKLFPADKQLGLDLSYIKGAFGKPVVLKASAFDTPATLRDRLDVELINEEMPFFKEGMLIKERDRQDLNNISQTGNQALIDVVTNRIFNDQATLTLAAKARLEAMRMSVLATGKIAILSNGVAKDFDYGLEESQHSSANASWDSVEATPIQDLENAISELEERGGVAEVAYLNARTFALLKNATDTLNRIKPGVENGAVTKSDLNRYLEDEYGIKLVVINETFKNENGEVKKYFPDGKVTLAPNAVLGRTMFGTTPAESDLVSGNDLSVQVIEKGIALTVETKKDPVNIQTNVSMISLPTFEQLESIQLLDVIVEEEDPTSPDEI